MDDLPGPREPLGLPAKACRTGAPGRNLRRTGTAGNAGQVLSSCHLLRGAGARACRRRLLSEIGNCFGLEEAVLMSWMDQYRSKLVTAGEAVSCVESGMRVYIHPGCAEPEALVE